MLRSLAPTSATFEHPREALVGRPSRDHGGLMRLGRTAVRTLSFWMERSRQRRVLAGLSDHELRDIGLTRDQVRRECADPFWSRN